MRNGILLVGIAALALVVVAGVGTPVSPSAPSPRVIPVQKAVPGRRAAFRSEGAGSCAARACHGSVDAGGRSSASIARNEYTTWLSDDPHAHAYEVLANPRSDRMVKLLRWAQPATREPRCLACHATPLGGVANLPEGKAAAIRREGVSCEACHGPANEWIDEHTKPTWTGKSRDRSKAILLTAAQKWTQYGMRPTTDLTDRAQVCAGCHIGSPPDPSAGFPIARDVNHDLIAAGHPRLMFELAGHLGRMPAHWRTTAKDPGTDFPARAWIIGQVAASRATVALHADRARKPRPAPWPEFAEYDCFACHHGLRDESWRQARKNAGQTDWGSWSLPMTRLLVETILPAQRRSPVQTALDDLQQEMASPNPPGRAAADRADRVVAELGVWLDDLRQPPPGRIAMITPRSIEDLIAALDPRSRTTGFWSWDQAKQTVLALRALHAQGAVPADVRDLEGELEFPAGYDGAVKFDPTQFGKTRRGSAKE